MAESNPVNCPSITVRRITTPPPDDDVQITLSLGDARRLYYLLEKGLPVNEWNAITAVRENLLYQLHLVHVQDKALS